MNQKSNKKKGLEYEIIVAKMLNKYTDYTVENKTIGSGCFWHSKGDMVISKNNDTYLLEVKGTGKDSYRISSKVISKIWSEALESSKLPLFAVLYDKKYSRTMVLFEIGMVRTTLNDRKKTYALHIKEIDEYIEMDNPISMTLQDDGIQWVVNIEKIVKEEI